MGTKPLKEILKEQNKAAAKWLVHYYDRKREYDLAREELFKKPEFIVKTNRKSKPTEVLAIKLAEHENNNAARWLQVIKEVEEELSKENNGKALLLSLRQTCKLYAPPDGGRPGWVAPVQIKFGERTGNCPAEQTLRIMWADIVELTVRVALMKKCEFWF